MAKQLDYDKHALRHLAGYSIVNAAARSSKNRRPASSAVLAVVLILVLSASGGFGGAWIENHTVSKASLTTRQQIGNSGGQQVARIANGIGPSVVSINVSIPTSASIGQDSFGLFDFSGPQTVQGAGTGIIISNKGLILTNRHVVPTGTSSVSVTLSDGTELKDVSIIGRTSETDSLDVAFLKINDTKGHKLAAAPIGNSANVRVGDNVITIGNALGQFQNTVTSGIISGYGRSVQAGDASGNSPASETLDNLFQTDAAINEGNSGGPLVNLAGQVIGMNTAVAGNAQNIGFAIPINDIRGLIAQVLKTGTFARPYLGVRYLPLTPDVASEFKLKVTSGAYVLPSQDPTSPSIIPDGPAAKAGLEEKDVITAIDGTKIDQRHSLISLLTSHQPGDKVQLTVLRADKTLQLSATLGKAPSVN